MFQLACARRDKLMDYSKRLDQANKQRGEAQRIIGKQQMKIEELERLLAAALAERR